MNPLAGLHPELVRRLGLLCDNAGVGVKFAPQSGLRTMEEQAALYALGRTVRNPDGACDARPLGLIVTHAGPGDSWHNYGLACDVVFQTSKPTDPEGVWHWDWSGNLPWAALGSAGESVGLEWGGRWPLPKTDLPHFELRLGLTLEQAKNLLHSGGLAAVWESVNQRLKEG